MSLPPLPRLMIEPAVRAALVEDLGRAGDVTSDAVIPVGTRTEAVLRAREAGVAAGLDAARLAFELVDPGLAVVAPVADGDPIAAVEVLLRVSGEARAILAAERVALNFAARLSGIATETRAIADAISHTGRGSPARARPRRVCGCSRSGRCSPAAGGRIAGGLTTRSSSRTTTSPPRAGSPRCSRGRGRRPVT